MAQPRVLLPTVPPVGAGRPALPLLWASQQPVGAGGGRYCERRLPRQSARRCSRIEPPCAPPEPPDAGILATTSMVVMVGDVCAVSGGQTAPLTTDIDLQRDHATALSEACERGSAEAMRAGKVCREGVLKVAGPSSKLRRAMGRRLTGADDGQSHPKAPR